MNGGLLVHGQLTNFHHLQVGFLLAGIQFAVGDDDVGEEVGSKLFLGDTHFLEQVDSNGRIHLLGVIQVALQEVYLVFEIVLVCDAFDQVHSLALVAVAVNAHEADADGDDGGQFVVVKVQMCHSVLVLGLFRMDGLRGLLLDEGIDQEADAQQDEGDAQELAHVQEHVSLEVYLDRKSVV